MSDYEYVVDRKSRGKLAPEYEDKLKEVCVGTLFGYCTEVVNVAQKTGIEEKILDNIVAEFGSLDTFRELYIEFLISNKISDESKSEKFIKIYENLAKKCQIINVFDITKPSLQGSATMSYLINLLTGEYGRGQIIDKKALNEALKHLKPKECYVLFEFAKGCGEVSLRKLSQKMNVTREMVRRYKFGGIYRMNSSSLRNIWIKDFDKDMREEFIRSFFEKRDIFKCKEEVAFSLEEREELLSILGVSIDSTKQNEISSDKNKYPEIPIDALELSTRAHNALIKGNYKSLADLLNNVTTLSQLVSIRQAGVKIIEEILDKVHSLGYKFKFEAENNEFILEDDYESQESKESKKLKLAIKNLKAAYKKYETNISECEALKEKLNYMVRDTEIQLSETKKDITILANKISSEELEEI